MGQGWLYQCEIFIDKLISSMWSSEEANFCRALQIDRNMRLPIIPHTQIWPITAQLFACKSSKVTNYFLWLWKACGGETCCRLSWLLPYLVRNVQFTSVWKSTEEREDAGRPTVDMARISHLQIVIFLKGGTPVCLQIRREVLIIDLVLAWEMRNFEQNKQSSVQSWLRGRSN